MINNKLINQPLLSKKAQHTFHSSFTPNFRNQLSAIPNAILEGNIAPYIDLISRQSLKRVARKFNQALSKAETSVSIMRIDIHYLVDRDGGLKRNLSKFESELKARKVTCVCICNEDSITTSTQRRCALGGLASIWGVTLGGVLGCIFGCAYSCGKYSTMNSICAYMWASFGVGLASGTCVGIGAACFCYQCIEQRIIPLLNEKTKTEKQITQTEQRLITTLTRLEKEFKATSAPSSKTSSAAMVSMLAVAPAASSSLGVKTTTSEKGFNAVEIEETSKSTPSTTFVENGVVYTGIAQTDDWKESDGKDFLLAVAGNNVTLQRDLLYAAAVRRGAVKSNGAEMKAAKGSDVLAEPPPAVPTTKAINR